MRVNAFVSLVMATLLAAVLTMPLSAGERSAAVLARPCAGCHGTAGASVGAIPAIRGKKARFIKTAMQEFKTGKREATVMGRIAKGYSDQEIERLAQYFASR